MRSLRLWHRLSLVSVLGLSRYHEWELAEFYAIFILGLARQGNIKNHRLMQINKPIISSKDIDKTTTVAVIHRTQRINNPDPLIFEQELTKKIESYIQQGYVNYIIPYFRSDFFFAIFIFTVTEIKKEYPNLRLIIMLPYEYHTEQIMMQNYYCNLADCVIFPNNKGQNKQTDIIINLFELSSALLTYLNNDELQYCIKDKLQDKKMLYYNFYRSAH